MTGPSDDKPFDIAVIGAGACGSAMAWEAASRGLRVAVVERDDICSSTSANSLRIVHGGLRYLQSLDVPRLRRSTAERSAMLRIAPHLVAPLRCLVPTQKNLLRGRLAMAGGLFANAILTIDRNRGLDPGRRLPAGGLARTDAYEAALAGVVSDGANGVAWWEDAHMLDPARLCLAFLDGARRLDARVFTHCEASDILHDAATKTLQIEVTDRLTAASRTIVARAVVDCRGLVHADLATAAETGTPPPMAIAVNVLLRRPAPPCAVGVMARDRQGTAQSSRLFFATPCESQTAVGTWYFPADAAAPTAAIDDDQLGQVLDDINRSTRWAVSDEDVLDVQAGLLPCEPFQPGEEPKPIDRPETRIWRPGPRCGVWRVQTEKWTTVRQLAEATVSAVTAALQMPVADSRTRGLPLPSAPRDHLHALESRLRRRLADGDPSVAARLLMRHGQTALDVLERQSAEFPGDERLPGRPDILLAEVAHCIEHEMPRTLQDLVERRFEFRPWVPPGSAALHRMAAMMGQSHGWSQAQTEQNIEACTAGRHARMV